MNKFTDNVIDIDRVHTFKKLLNSTSFGTETSFIVELIQNTQRSNSSKVEIVLDGDFLSVSDNGEGCSNPSDVFNISKSGFGIGFGEGFTSLYGLHGFIEVKSQDWSATFDVEKISKSENLSLSDLTYNPKKESDYFNGFYVSVKSEKLLRMNYSIKKEIQNTCPLIDSIDFYLNGEYIEKRSLFDIEINDGFSHSFSNRFGYGLITPIPSNSYPDKAGIDVFFENRFVCNLYSSFQNFYGVFSLKHNKVDLRSPDRTAIIKNEKFYNFKEALTRQCENLVHMILKSENSEMIEKYSSPIQSSLDISKIIRFLSVENSSAFYKNKTSTQTPNITNNIETSNGIDFSNVSEIIEALPSIAALNDIEFKERSRPEDVFKSAVKPVSKDNLDDKEKLKKSDLDRIKITDLKKYKNVVWVEQENIKYHKETMDLFEYYGVTFFISTNSIYSEALRYLNIIHISELSEETLVKEYKISNAFPKTAKEKRSLEILSFIEKIFDLENVFYISNIDATISLSLYNDKKIFKEKMIVGGYSSYPSINLNRKVLRIPSSLSSNLGKDKFSKSDFLFVVSNFELISHELAHHIYDTKDNTKEHYTKIFEIQEVISKTLFLS